MLTEQVRDFWEREACGTAASIVRDAPPHSRAWFDRVEAHRYRVEPFIHSAAQFSRWHGKRVLEIGVGAGTDHLQWARAGADAYGVDLTHMAADTTRRHLAVYGFAHRVLVANAERLPYDTARFDAVYSWGVIHHAEFPERIVAEVHRVLKPGGAFIGMLYGRHSSVAVKLWLRYALLTGQPWRTLSDVVWHHMESTGTKAYTASELRQMWGAFRHVSVQPVLTPYDTRHWPRFVGRLLPAQLGWFMLVEARK